VSFVSTHASTRSHERERIVPGPLIAIVGDASSTRTFDPAMKAPQTARKAAEELGAELARRGARLLVYGGPYIEADVVRGYIGARPPEDRSVVMWYSKDQEPPPFAEEEHMPKLFERRLEKGGDWEVAFYRSITRADGVILVGGGNATKISGYVAIGSRMPILALSEFGGGAARVWNTLSAGADLPSREDIDLMARPWTSESAPAFVSSLLAQHSRRQTLDGAPSPGLAIFAGALFIAALSIVPWVWGGNVLPVWMLFAAPVLAGGAGAAIRPAVDHAQGSRLASALVTTVVLGLVAGGIAGVLFVTAQLTADPQLTSDAARIGPYAQRSIPFALGVGFVAGLTAHAVLGKLLGVDVVRTTGIALGAKSI
jgi:hypothetical protein